jgi:hypothetical protein
MRSAQVLCDEVNTHCCFAAPCPTISTVAGHRNQGELELNDNETGTSIVDEATATFGNEASNTIRWLVIINGADVALTDAATEMMTENRANSVPMASHSLKCASVSRMDAALQVLNDTTDALLDT